MSDELMNRAKEAAQSAYAPYSQYKVGSAILTSDGTIFTGCNIENVSYGLTICAERVVIYKAVSEGYKDFKTLAIYASDNKLPYPCGACLQVISEFCQELDIYISNSKGEVIKEKKSSLIPHPFISQRLKEHGLSD